MTSILPFSGTLRRWIIASLECRDVGFRPSLDVAMLDPNVATLATPLSGTSRRCPVYRLEALHILSYPHTLLPEPIVATSDHLAASTTTSLHPLTPVLRPCLEHPSPRSGALTPPLSAPNELDILMARPCLVHTVRSG